MLSLFLKLYAHFWAFRIYFLHIHINCRTHLLFSKFSPTNHINSIQFTICLLFSSCTIHCCCFCRCYLRISLIDWHLITLLNINWKWFICNHICGMRRVKLIPGKISSTMTTIGQVNCAIVHASHPLGAVLSTTMPMKIFVCYRIINSHYWLILCDREKSALHVLIITSAECGFFIMSDLWFMQNMCIHIALSLFIY